jgi:hypothetical protein
MTISPERHPKGSCDTSTVHAGHTDEHADHIPELYPCGASLPRTRTVTTRDLTPGMRVLLPHVVGLGRHVRTVTRVAENGWLNARNEPLVNVYYAEPAGNGWGEGNSGLWDSEWHVIDTSTPNQPHPHEE